MIKKVEDTLKERGSRYGEFHAQAWYAQGIKAILQASPNWNEMTDDQREALDMIANKIGRILNGDPDYADSWHDIAGYAELVEKRIEERKKLQAIATADYNARVDDYLQATERWGSRAEEITNYAQEAVVQENGDYDPIHKGLPYNQIPPLIEGENLNPTWFINPAPLSEAPGEPNPAFSAVASVERGEVLGIHPVWPEEAGDSLAPEACISRCY